MVRYRPSIGWVTCKGETMKKILLALGLVFAISAPVASAVTAADVEPGRSGVQGLRSITIDADSSLGEAAYVTPAGGNFFIRVIAEPRIVENKNQITATIQGTDVSGVIEDKAETGRLLQPRSATCTIIVDGVTYNGLGGPGHVTAANNNGDQGGNTTMRCTVQKDVQSVSTGGSGGE